MATQKKFVVKNGLISQNNVDITGNLAISGTVDGRNIATDGAKLDNVAVGATAYGDSNVASYLGSNGYGTSSSIIASITDSAPGTLDTLNELAAALGDDANFSTTVTNSIATKLPLAGGTLTGNVNFGDNDRAIFGAGSDLQIYHTGSTSYISEQGAGGLVMRGTNLFLRNSANENYLGAIADGSVTIYHDNVEKLATTSTGIDVTGTVTSDGLTVGDGTGAESIRIDKGGSSAASIDFYSGGAASGKIEYNVYEHLVTSSVGPTYLKTNSVNRMQVGSNGDISFYEDTGTTAKFFWDTSAERLGIKTSSPDFTLSVGNDSDSFNYVSVRASNTGSAGYLFSDAQDADVGYVNYSHATNHMGFGTNGAERMRIDSSGNVGIGTSPSQKLHIGSSGFAYLRTTSTSYGGTGFDIGQHTNGNIYLNNRDNTSIILQTNNTERLRIDSSGNLLVGTTSTNPQSSSSVEGVQIAPDHIGIGRDANTALYLNRQSNDGTIAVFRKDGTTVGSIGVSSGVTTYIDGGSQFAGLQFGGDGISEGRITPRRNGASSDNTTDLGTSSLRFKDLHLSGNVNVGGTVDGRDVAADGTKLDGIATSANNYSHPNHTGEVTSTGDGAMVIANNVVDEANLKVSNSPTNGYFLSAQSGNTGGLTWSAVPAGYTDGDVASYLSANGYGTSSSIIGTITDSAPGTLDTLNELAAALGDDANFSTTVTNSIATKLPLAGGTLTGNVNFGDNDKAIFGAGSDLQIYHDGSNSYIKNNSGVLRLHGTEVQIKDEDNNETLAVFNPQGSVDLYYDNAKKLATTSTGIDVTGTVTADRLNIYNTAASLTAAATFYVNRNGGTPSSAKGLQIYNNTSGGFLDTALVFGDTANSYFEVGHHNGTSYEKRFRINSGGNATFYKGAVFNEDGLDQDFRVESDASANMFVVDAAENKVGINRSPNISNSKLEVGGADNVPIFNVEASGVTGGMGIGASGLQFFHGSSSKLAISSAGNASFAGNILIPNKIEHTGDADTYLQFSTGDDWRVVTGNIERFSVNNSAVVINEESADMNFRVESNSNTHMLFVDAGVNKIGINRSVPGHTVDVVSGTNSGDDGIALRPLNVSQKNILSFLGLKSTYFMQFMVDSGNIGSSDYFQFHAGTQDANGELLFLGDSGTVFNQGGQDRDFRVESANNANMLFVDAGNDKVSIGMTGGSEVLNVKGSLQLDHFGSDSFSKIVGPDNRTLKVVLRANDNNDAFLVEDDRSAGSERLTVNAGGEMVVNDTSADYDFRVESNNNTHMLFVNAGNDKVGINESSPDYTLHVNSLTTNVVAKFESTDSTSVIQFVDNNGNSEFGTSGNTARISPNGSYAVLEASQSAVVINNAAQDTDFRVESTGNTHALFVNGENNHVDIGGARAGSVATHSVVVSDKTQLGTSVGDTNRIFGICGTTNNSDYLTFRTRRITAGQSGWNHSVWDITREVDNTASIFHYQTFGMTEIVFNESSANIDFRVESDNNTHALFVDAGANTVSVDATFIADTGTGTQNFNITRSGQIDQALSVWVDDANVHLLATQDESDASYAGFEFKSTNGVNSNRGLLYMNQQQTIFNESGNDTDFRVESNNNTHALFVEAGANRVGINNNNPNSQLDISGAGVPRVTLTSTSGPYGYMEVNTVGSVGFGADPNGSGSSTNMAFNVDNVETARFYSGSNVFNEVSGDIDFRVESDTNAHALFLDASYSSTVCFGTSNINLHNVNTPGVNIGGNGNVGQIIASTFGNRPLILHRYHNTGMIAEFGYNTATVGSINVTASGTTYNTTSDRRLKDNIQPISDATDKLMDMKPVTHTWIDNPDEPQVHGFIAQEMQEVVPEAVSGDAESDEMMSMDYGRITPVIVAALQDALNEIKELKTRIDELENK